MVKYSLFAVIVVISVAYAMSAPASKEEPVDAGSPVEGEVEDIQPSATKKIKRGIYGGGYGGYGFGHYPYSYSYYPSFGGHYGGYGHGYGYGHYPYYSIGHHGYGHYGHGYGSIW